MDKLMVKKKGDEAASNKLGEWLLRLRLRFVRTLLVYMVYPWLIIW